MKRKIESATIARTVVLIFALVNQVLTMSDWNPLPFAEDDVYTAVITIITVGATIWSWWKNNSITQPALEADEYKKEIKNVKNYMDNNKSEGE